VVGVIKWKWNNDQWVTKNSYYHMITRLNYLVSYLIFGLDLIQSEGTG